MRIGTLFLAAAPVLAGVNIELSKGLVLKFRINLVLKFRLYLTYVLRPCIVNTILSIS